MVAVPTCGSVLPARLPRAALRLRRRVLVAVLAAAPRRARLRQRTARGDDDARPVPAARGVRRDRGLVHRRADRGARPLDHGRGHVGRGRLLVRGRDPPRGRDRLPPTRRALHVPGVLLARAARRAGRRLRVLLPGAGARRAPLRGVRGQRHRLARAVRGGEGDRRGGPPAGPRHDRGRRQPGSRRDGRLRPPLLRALPGAAAGDTLLRPAREPRLRGGEGQGPPRRLHTAPQRSPRPRSRVLLLAGARGCADDRPRHEPDAGDAAHPLGSLAHRGGPAPRHVPPRLPAPHDVRVRAQRRLASAGAPGAGAALHVDRGRRRVQRPRPHLRAHPPDRGRRVRDHGRGGGSCTPGSRRTPSPRPS